MSQLKTCDFSRQTFKGFGYNFLWLQRRHNCSPAASFANCVMTLYLLKVHLQTFLSLPITQKCQILSCDTLVANERYIYRCCRNNKRMRNRPAFTCCNNKAIFHLGKDEKACLPSSSASASPFVAVSSVMNHVCQHKARRNPLKPNVAVRTATYSTVTHRISSTVDLCFPFESYNRHCLFSYRTTSESL
jgi:hypothetical protein